MNSQARTLTPLLASTNGEYTATPPTLGTCSSTIPDAPETTPSCEPTSTLPNAIRKAVLCCRALRTCSFLSRGIHTHARTRNESLSILIVQGACLLNQTYAANDAATAAASEIDTCTLRSCIRKLTLSATDCLPPSLARDFYIATQARQPHNSSNGCSTSHSSTRHTST
jgi:hypothetical protein